MKTLAILLGALLISFSSYSQELETLGAGVIDFLLTKPSTANNMNATEAAALSTISSLLKISASRKHDMNVANTGRSEIIINTESGNEAKIYSDKDGNLYLLFNDQITAISSGLVDQAKNTSSEKEIRNSTLNGYNMTELERGFRFARKTDIDWERYFVTEPEEYLHEIAEKKNVTIDDIYFNPVLFHPDKEPLFSKSRYTLPQLYPTTARKKLYKSRKPIKLIKTLRPMELGTILFFKGFCIFSRGGSFTYPGYSARQMSRYFAIYIRKEQTLYHHEILSVFTFNWAKDFDEKGLDFDDFQGVKRSFVEGEKMMFALGYTTETPGNWSLEVYEASTGNVVYNKDGVTEKGGRVVSFEKDGEKLEPGVYMYNFTLTADGEENLMKLEKFEIIAEEKE